MIYDTLVLRARWQSRGSSRRWSTNGPPRRTSSPGPSLCATAWNSTTATPVTSEDVVPSLKRWAVRDPLGQALFSKVAEVKAIDPKTFQIVLKAPTGIMLQALGKPSGNAFIMPRKVAEDRPCQADRRLHRLWPLHLRQERVEARRQDGLHQEPQVQAQARAPRRVSPAARSPKSIASNGSPSPTSRPRPARSSRARST